MATTYETIICAVPLENSGISTYIIDSLKRKFGFHYKFITRDNNQTDEQEVICVSNFPMNEYVREVMRGKHDFRT